jgi:quercetin dioxygenase-like cupin family protein
MTTDVVVTAAELEYRTILRVNLTADRDAFLDTRIPGSEAKINYPLIGPGVSENAEQVVPVTEPHGFNLGGAVMPAGVVNNLHLHFTAEVFVCFAGEWQFRWGAEGSDGEAIVADGDVISIPTWIFRGFTSLTDDAWLYTALGRDVSGGLIWAPSVIEEAARYGMHLGVDNKIIETAPGEVPTDVELIAPLSAEQLASLRKVSTDEMRERLAKPADLVWCDEPFLDSRLPAGGAQLALVVGHGITENRFQRPRLADPHGLALAWLRAEPGQGVGPHRMAEAQVLIVKSGRLRVTLNIDEPVSVELGPYDTLSVPRGAWRRFESVGEARAQWVTITEGDGRVYLDWTPEIVVDARAKGVARDPNGYLAPASMLNG